MANILELAALKTINMENFSSWAPAQVLKFKSWKDILAIKEATVREHNVFTCICLELSDQDKAIFPHKLPGDCVLEPKQSAKTCDGVGCDQVSVVRKLVVVYYKLAGATISEDIQLSKLELPGGVSRVVEVHLCLGHFRLNFGYSCMSCSNAWHNAAASAPAETNHTTSWNQR